MANVKFLQGTKERFQSITPDNNTFYLVDGQDLYLGSQKLNNQTEIDAAVVRVAKNEGDILTLRADLDAFAGESGSSSISELLAALETRLQGYADNAASTAAGNEASRAQTAEAVLEKKITDLTTTVNSNESDIEDKMTALTETVNGHTTTLTEHGTSIGNLNSKIDTQIGNVQASIANIGERIDDLLGDDLPEDGSAAPTIRAIAEEAASAKVDAVVDGAPESFNTLKDIANWIENDESGAASIANTVATHGQKIQTLEGNYSTLRTDVNNNDVDIKALQDADIELDRRLDTAEGAIATVDSRITTAKEAAIGEAARLDAAMGLRVGAVEGRLSAAETTITGHGGRLTTVEGKVTANETAIAGHTTQISEAQSAITALQQTLTEYGDIVNHNWNEVTSAVATAKQEAITEAGAYIDNCLTWNPIQ